MNAGRQSSSSGPSAYDPAGRSGSGGLPVLPKPGDVVAGKYRIEKVVGEGGMGIVYAAHHLVLDQRVALKLLLIDSLRGEETVERFVREAQAAARLRSEHVVRVTDAGAIDGGLPFLVMEYLQGCDLAELARRGGPLPSADVADYLLQVLSALAQAHTAGIVHRDLKPANLFLALREDGSNVIKVLDFGISKQTSERAKWKELTGKTVLGTPAYMSPEQLRSSKNVDARADIWSLGVVMYELLSGKLPFDGESPGEIFAAILEQAPVPLRVHCPHLPQAWEDAVMRCLRRAPAERFADVGELAASLTPLGSGRWAHALAAIGQAFVRSARGSSKTDTALLAAAVSAAVHSMPPPMRAPVPLGGGLARVDRSGGAYATLGTGKTLVADLLVSHETAHRKPALWSVKAIAGICLMSCLVVVASMRRPHPPPTASTAPAASVASTRAAAVVWKEPAGAMDANEDGSAHSANLEREPLQTSPAAHDGPLDPRPAPPRGPSAGMKPGSMPRPSPGPLPKQANPGTRPKFLKSWR